MNLILCALPPICESESYKGRRQRQVQYRTPKRGIRFPRSRIWRHFSKLGLSSKFVYYGMYLIHGLVNRPSYIPQSGRCGRFTYLLYYRAHFANNKQFVFAMRDDNTDLVIVSLRHFDGNSHLDLIHNGLVLHGDGCREMSNSYFYRQRVLTSLTIPDSHTSSRRWSRRVSVRARDNKSDTHFVLKDWSLMKWMVSSRCFY